MPTDVIKALLPVLAAGFAVQRLLEILDPVVVRLGGEEKKRHYLGLLSLIAGLTVAFRAHLQVLLNLGISTGGFEYLDYLVSGLIISAGTEGVNSILKFLSYKKEEKKEEAKAETVHAASARALFETRLSSNFFRSARLTAAPGEFVISGDLAKDLAEAFKDEMKSRWPDQYKEDGWEDRTFDAYITDLELFKMQEAAVEASDTVARAYGVELSEAARLRIQNRVKLTSNPKKLLPIMEDEVASA